MILIYFDCGIYLSHECIGADISDCAAHDTQGQAEQCHIAKIKCRLKETVHSVKTWKDVDETSNICDRIANITVKRCMFTHLVLKKK